jgi:hypothetical protein
MAAITFWVIILATGLHDGKRRMVQVEVRGHPDYATTGRRSYFAPEPDQ